MSMDNKSFSDSLLLTNTRITANASLLILAEYLRSLSDDKLRSEEYLTATMQEEAEVGRVGMGPAAFWNISLPGGFQQIWDNISFQCLDDKVIDLCEGAKIIFGDEPIKMVVGVHESAWQSFLVNARMGNYRRWLVNIGDHYCGAVKYLRASSSEYKYPVGIGYNIETRNVFIYRSPDVKQILSGSLPTEEERILLDMIGCSDPTEIPRFRSVVEEHQIDLAVFPADKFFMNLHRSGVNFPAAEGRWDDC